MPSLANGAVAPWLAEPRRLWSLLEMIEFNGHHFVATLTLLREARSHMELCAGVRITPLTVSGSILQAGPATELSSDQRKWIAHLAESAQQASNALGLSDCALLANSLHSRLTGPQSCNYERAQSELESIIALMHVGLSKQKFAFVPLDRHEYFEADNLLGLSMPSPLPTTDDDVRDAGNALALGMPAAAAFHLLRVAELAMRELYAAKGITIPNRPNIADTDWSELIDNLDTWLTAEIVKLSTPSPKRGSPERILIDTYNALISDARFLKSERNKVMHPRHKWTMPDALVALTRVRGFTQHVQGLL